MKINNKNKASYGSLNSGIGQDDLRHLASKNKLTFKQWVERVKELINMNS